MKTLPSLLNDKLKHYSTFVGVITFATGTANAGIIYTNIFPDDVSTGSLPFDIDMNNDGIEDFALDHNVTTARYFGADNLVAGNGVFASSTSAGDAYAMSSNSLIGASLSFNSNNNVRCVDYQTFSGGQTFGNGSWLGGLDKYLGVRFYIGGDLHYGWIRVNLNSDGSVLTIKDYAFENTPNTSILAGNTGLTGLSEEELAGKINLATESNSITIGVSDAQLLNDAEVSLITTDGKTLSSFPLNSEEQTVTVKEKGLLIVRIRVEDAVLNRKVYVTGN